MTNKRIIALELNGAKCSLIIEVSGLGAIDRINLDSEQIIEFRNLKNELDSQNKRNQDRDLQNEIIAEFRRLQALQERQAGSVYAECQNAVDCW